MNPNVSPELQRGLFDLIYFTWLHNAEVIAYFTGAMLMLAKQFRRPSRSTVVLFVGFVLLLLEFEYVKHIVEPLEQQTLQTVLQQGASGVRFQHYTSLLLHKLLPLGMYVGGWGSIFASLLVGSRLDAMTFHWPVYPVPKAVKTTKS